MPVASASAKHMLRAHLDDSSGHEMLSRPLRSAAISALGSIATGLAMFLSTPLIALVP